MSSFTIARVFDAPLERVFERATDFACLPEIIGGIKSLELLTEGPVGLGTRFRQTRTMFGQEATQELEVTSFQSPNSWAIGCENHGSRFHTAFHLRSTERGTELEMVFEVTPLTVAARMMGTLMKPMLKACQAEMETDMDELKVAIEGPQTTA